MCGLLMLLITGPRITMVLWWLIAPGRWERAFQDEWVWPVLGFIFLPWTTLMFVIVAPNGNVVDIDWLWLALAFVLDVSTSGLGGIFGRRRTAYA
jgi:hypothetical protein